MAKDFRIFLKGKDCTNQVIKYQRIRDKYNVIFNNEKLYTYSAYNVKLIESVLKDDKTKNCFDYLKEIACAVGVVKNGENILLANYDRIDFIDKDCILASFLGFNSITECCEIFYNVIYPFGFNNSQAQAVNKALSNKLSVIQGPPGTGKTQTILNIAANIVMLGQSVAIVSSNNSATKNVLDKLKKYDVDFIAAYLGNFENKLDFINSQSDLSDMSNWNMSLTQLKEMKRKLDVEYKELRHKLDAQNKLASFKQELSNTEIEQKHFLDYYKTLNHKYESEYIRNIKSSVEVLDMIFLCDIYQDCSYKNTLIKFLVIFFKYLSFWNRKKLVFLYKLITHEKHSLDFLKAQFQNKFYELKIMELKLKISCLEKELLAYNFDSKMKEYENLSIQLFKHKLSEKYSNNKRDVYKLEDLKTKSKLFIQDYPIILSTVYSLRNCLENGVMYDYVIVDEASQVDLCAGALALSCARKAVIVGDLKQLPNVVDYNDAKATDYIFSKYKLSESYRYKNHCLLSSILELFPSIPITLLREHYRCHPKIIEFCNRKFYDNELIILSNINSNREPLVLCYTSEGRHERDHYNQRQIDVIVNEVIPKYHLCIDDYSVGIVTPYRNQTEALQETFRDFAVKADTVDKFQGQENKVIVISTVDNEISNFTDNPNRLNVAISRAIEQLIIIINPYAISKDKNIYDLINYIKYNNFEIYDSKLYSIFDYLYKSYEARKVEILANHKSISAFDSENLAHNFIKEFLNKYYKNQLDVAVHVPLKSILRDRSLLNPGRECEFALNNLTHIDFVIYKKIDNSLILAIEVDGYKYHQTGTKQAERDNLKNGILKRYGIPLLRFKTNGSDEARILKETINNLI